MECGLAKLYCDKKIDFTKEPMFLGKGKNLQRYDVFSHKLFDDINKTMQGFFWKPEEIDLTKDSLDIQNILKALNISLPEDITELYILTLTLQKLIFLDSIMGRGPFLTLGQLTTIPELEGAILTWDFFESIHSRSYSWILQNCYPDPSIIFNEIYDIKEIKDIADFISGYYNKFYQSIITYQYQVLNNKTIDKNLLNNLKIDLLNLLMTVNCLEGIEFLSGFTCIWSLTEAKGIFPGTSKILQLIARDELQHLRLTQNINKLLRDDDSEGFKELWHKNTTEFYNIYLKAVTLEEKFIKKLYSKGSIIGMNEEIAKEYLYYVANQRLKVVGLKPMFKNVKENPIASWSDKYYNFSNTQGALQEIESTDYKIGGIIFDNKYNSLKELQKQILNNIKEK